MTELEAREAALIVIRRKLAHEKARHEINRIIFEGQCGPGDPGWQISGDVMTVPMPSLGNGPCFRFGVRDLIESIESPQAGLFS